MSFKRFFISIGILFLLFSCDGNYGDVVLLDSTPDYPYQNGGDTGYSYQDGDYWDYSVPEVEGGDETAVWEPTGKNSVFELSPSVGTLQIEAEKESQVYFARINTSSFMIPEWETRYVLSSGGQRFASESRGITLDQIVESPADFPVDYAPARDFDSSLSPSVLSRSAVTEEKDYSYLLEEYEVGDTRVLYTDDEYTKEKATLVLGGEYCNFWVVDGYLTTEGIYPGGLKINQNTLIYLRNSFDKAYPMVHGLFGKEQDYIVDNNGKMFPINKKVNIVIYDIKKDAQKGGVMGFFWEKDFYTSDKYAYSNEGKFFYMDSPWICNSIGLAASTLVHEFQHMINFSRKSGSSTWFNEMLSMVCEEVLASPMGIYEKNTPRNRLFQFCEGYWKRGLTTWISDDSVLYSYAMSFAFGAFLIRNYGGIPLLQEIASNSSLNKNSIEDALMARGIDKTFDQVFTEFVISLVLKDGSEQSSASFNKSLEYNIGGSNFSIPTINLDDYSVKLSDGTSTKGPVLFDAGKEGQMDLHPYGFSLHEIGSTSEDGTLTLNFSKAVSADEKIYVLVK